MIFRPCCNHRAAPAPHLSDPDAVRRNNSNRSSSLPRIGNDKEAWAYALSLKDLLRTAGFEVASEMLMFISSGDGAVGVRMAIKNEDHQPPFAGDIQRGFESIGIRTPAVVEPKKIV
jgi:hypothetical protein